MQPKKSKHLTKIVVITATVLLVVTATLILTYNRWGLHPVSTPNTAGNQKLLHGTVIIDNGSYYLQFIVPDGALNIHVTGNYSVQTNSPIRLYVMDQTVSNSGVNKAFSTLTSTAKNQRMATSMQLYQAAASIMLFLKTAINQFNPLWLLI